jgi:predicted rRNA methylase YqxC with S4 and FtsJ domains
MIDYLDLICKTQCEDLIPIIKSQLEFKRDFYQLKGKIIVEKKETEFSPVYIVKFIPFEK